MSAAGVREMARLLGGGAAGGKFHSIPCPAHHDAKPSASIWVGSDGRLHACCFAGCAAQAVLAAIGQQTRLIAPDGTFLTAAAGPAWQDCTREAENIEAEIAEAKRAFELAQRVELIWNAAAPLQEDCLGARYLRDTRGLRLPQLLGALRLHPGLYHPWSRQEWPALLGQVVDADGEFVAIHRTWLDPGSANKAPVEQPRASLGPVKGGAVRLWEVPGSTDVMVAEGIETALATAQLAGWRYPAWAALSTSGLTALVVPRRFRRVAIMGDSDANGAGEHAARILAHRLRKRGLRVVVRLPPVVGQDFNDVLLAQRDAGKKAT
jgi:hypothetical protein